MSQAKYRKAIRKQGKLLQTLKHLKQYAYRNIQLIKTNNSKKRVEQGHLKRNEFKRFLKSFINDKVSMYRFHHSHARLGREPMLEMINKLKLDG